MVAETAGTVSDNAAAMAHTPIAPERIHAGLFVGNHLRMRTPWLDSERGRPRVDRPLRTGACRLAVPSAIPLTLLLLADNGMRSIWHTTG
jgi:hypothetical protein